MARVEDGRMDNPRIDFATPRAHDRAGFDQALTRARAEFLEMPGLRLNAAQAARLWSCDAAVSDAVLTSLTESHFLARTRDGSFIRT
jgi:hypothetical protein